MTQKRATDPHSPDAYDRDNVILLDLSGDERAARLWASEVLPGESVKPINKAELKWQSKREALSRVRQLAPQVFAVFTSDVGLQSARGAILLFAAASGARRVILGDRSGRLITRSRLTAFFIEAPRFALELLAGYAVVAPLAWLLTAVLSLSLELRGVVRADRFSRSEAEEGNLASIDEAPLSVLYLRATLSTAAEGGMATHVAGFASGARSLGHRLRFIESGRRRSSDSFETYFIAPSSAISATRALFELWNNLVFTLRSVQVVCGSAGAARDFDFIYQRYSRFNWTGAALSILTGLPLALEFNGSEVWVSKRWDPVGHIPLLKRFERLNLRAADVVFTVSDVQRRELIESGMDEARVIANPNGVDADEFHPDCGGKEVRRRLGIDDKIVVGFLGTFGPWHGAPVLAEAALLVSREARCHFLFIGDGDQRAMAESIMARSGVSDRATFAGRAPHAMVPAYLDACDILVSPHVHPADGGEFFGSPTKLFEYMAMARPVVASRLGQIADVMTDGENGLLVEPGDGFALARAIERLAGDEALRARLGAAARETVVQKYTWRRNAARVFDAMRQFV